MDIFGQASLYPGSFDDPKLISVTETVSRKKPFYLTNLVLAAMVIKKYHSFEVCEMGRFAELPEAIYKLVKNFRYSINSEPVLGIF